MPVNFKIVWFDRIYITVMFTQLHVQVFSLCETMTTGLHFYVTNYLKKMFGYNSEECQHEVDRCWQTCMISKTVNAETNMNT